MRKLIDEKVDSLVDQKGELGFDDAQMDRQCQLLQQKMLNPWPNVQGHSG